MISKNHIKLIKQLEQKKYRQRNGLFVAEGPKVVGDLIAAGYQPAALYATTPTLLDTYQSQSSHASMAQASLITPDELRRISFLQHPQQVLALFTLPTTPSLSISHSLHLSISTSPSLALALDGVQDPGNLGTIIRIADWFGIDHIFCSQDTADAWSPKVVQATMGSIARVSIAYVNLPELLCSLPADYPVYGTLLDGNNLYTQPLTPHGIIVMGSEGNGISSDVRPFVNRRLLIPPFRQGPTAESLNVGVATAIVCAEFRRRSKEGIAGSTNES